MSFWAVDNRELTRKRQAAQRTHKQISKTDYMFLAELHRNITGRLWRVVRIDSSITKDIHFVCLYGSLLAPIWGQVFVRPASNRHATQTTPSYQRLKTTTGGAAIGDGHRDICTLLAPPQLLEQYARKKLVQKRKKKRNKGKTDDIRPGTHSETIFLYVCWTAIKTNSIQTVG
jgi:hypothetical protein